MKMRSEHYEIISNALDAVSLDVENAFRAYALKGHYERFRWDALRFAKIDGDSTAWLCRELYPYLNDEHIDSALRKYFQHPAPGFRRGR